MSNARSNTRSASCDIAEYRTWRERRTGPAYLRGVPTWVWRQSLRARPGERID